MRFSDLNGRARILKVMATLGVAAVMATGSSLQPALAATPPATVNYQGVLRDQNDVPLTGTYDMVMRFMDAATAGNEILVDQHTAANANAVAVSGGLFNVVLGSGTVVDGSGPGTYASPDAVFRDHGSVWLEIQVGVETLSPRTRFHSSAFSLNATNLGGHPDDYYLNTSTQYQIKTGQLDINNPEPGGGAMIATGGNTGFKGRQG